MEDKKINSQQSIELITRMLQHSQNNIRRYAGAYCLLWGYITFTVSLAVFFTFHATHNYKAHLLWIAIPVAGAPLMFFIRRRIEPPVRTFVDTAIGKIWIPVGISLFIFPFFVPNPLLVVSLLLGIVIAQCGLIVKYPVFTVAGFIGIAGAFSLLVFRGEEQILIFAALSLLVLVIPGHLANRKAARHVQAA